MTLVREGNSRWSISEILQQLVKMDPKRRLMNEATAYRITARFLEKGWLEQAWRLPDSLDERPRREFWLSSEGVQAATSELKTYSERTSAKWAALAVD